MVEGGIGVCGVGVMSGMGDARDAAGLASAAVATPGGRLLFVCMVTSTVVSGFAAVRVVILASLAFASTGALGASGGLDAGASRRRSRKNRGERVQSIHYCAPNLLARGLEG